MTCRGRLTAIGLLLLLGACGKSAQVPLQSWLGDAMEGPTPVSALIHAATMVTAGVYLIVRSGPIFNLAPAAQTAVVIVGAVTLLFGAIIGCAKDDIKKALAASTMSQIGYMVLAAGLGPAGYAFAIMHLLTHGFFKAGLFLGAGSVMHGMDDETDMRRYGGLRTLLPITYVTFGLGYLAIIGVPPFAGFFSKDAIIEAAFDSGGFKGCLLGGAALLGAGITAFYMTRVMLLTFFGGHAGPKRRGSHPHESPAVMTGPMIVLAVGSVGAGAVLAIGGHPGTLARTGRRQPPRPNTSSPPGSSPSPHSASSPSASRSPTGSTPCDTVPEVAPRGVGPDRRGPPRPLRRRGQRGSVHAARPGTDPALWSTSTTGRRRRGQRPGGRWSAGRRTGCAGCRPASPAPTRCRCSPGAALVLAAILVW